MQLSSMLTGRADEVLGSYPIQSLLALRELGMTRAMLRRYFRTDDRQIEVWAEAYGIHFPDHAGVAEPGRSARAGL